MKRSHSKPLQPLHASFALLLFLFGSNYCIVSAVASSSASRAGVLCHEVSGGGSKTAKAATGSCCATRTTTNDRARPVQTPGSPCCMELAQVSSPELTKQVCASTTPMACAELAATLTSASPRIPAHPPRTDLRARPLASPAGGPLALRAPPRI